MNKLIVTLLKGRREDRERLLKAGYSEGQLLNLCDNGELKTEYNLEKGYGFERYHEIKDLCRKMEIELISICDKEYPESLKEIYDPPFSLFVRGNIEALHCDLISVVGTRKATLRGFHEAFKLGLDLGRESVGVVSGLALGIDSASHSGNVAAGGKTVAVLGSGVDTIYPKSNKKLAGDILQSGGAIISEFIPGESPKTYNFPKRNRVIAGLSRDLVIIQAPKKSGSLITGEFALQRGGDVYVHGIGIGDKRFLGSDSYHKDGAVRIDSAIPLLNKFGRVTEVIDFDPEGYSSAEITNLELEGKIVKFKGCYFRL